jgi:cellulose synthase/poly-beta-1,6-N-acetylglucosamine synthase-like glycosyltransferase
MGDVVQNLIDLAGSESSKTETTGLRRKEGSFINKSLLTLGTVNFLFSFFLSFHEGRKHCSPKVYVLLVFKRLFFSSFIMLCSWMVIAINMCDVVSAQ